MEAPSPTREFLLKTIQLAVQNVGRGGGPFAALVVKEGKILSWSGNRVTAGCDPTAHAEIMAIRRACRKLKTFQLTGCDLYSSCEPCPMCFGAIYWSRPLRVFYSATWADALRAGFDDRLIYSEIRKTTGDYKIPMWRVELPEAEQPFNEWIQKANKIQY